MIVGDCMDARQAFLVTDSHVVAEVDFIDIPLVLMASFFIFNICYPRACCNFYAFMEVYTLGFDLCKASPMVRHFVSSLGDD